MISEVVMPQMGADMVEGTILKWLKHEGDPVERGEIIAEIETDKANVEIEAFEGGIFRTTLAAEGDTVAVGQIIAIIAAADDDVSNYTSASPAPSALVATSAADAVGAQPAAPASVSAQRTAPAPTTAIDTRSDRSSDLSPSPTAPSPPATNVTRIRVSPVARNLAEQHNIDLRTIRGTGPDSRIIRRDIESAIASTTSNLQPPTTNQPSKSFACI